MRIIVFSDSHGSFSSLDSVIEKNLSADIFIHLGDGEREISRILNKYPDINFHHIRGNCDFSGIAPTMEIIGVLSHKIIAVHGNLHDVKLGTSGIISLAKKNHADIALFGHTHQRFSSYEEGIYILNPGSISIPRDGNKPSYGFIDITTAGIVTNIVNV